MCPFADCLFLLAVINTTTTVIIMGCYITYVVAATAHFVPWLIIEFTTSGIFAVFYLLCGILNARYTYWFKAATTLCFINAVILLINCMVKVAQHLLHQNPQERLVITDPDGDLRRTRQVTVGARMSANFQQNVSDVKKVWIL